MQHAFYGPMKILIKIARPSSYNRRCLLLPRWTVALRPVSKFRLPMFRNLGKKITTVQTDISTSKAEMLLLKTKFMNATRPK